MRKSIMLSFEAKETVISSEGFFNKVMDFLSPIKENRNTVDYVVPRDKEPGQMVKVDENGTKGYQMFPKNTKHPLVFFLEQLEGADELLTQVVKIKSKIDRDEDKYVKEKIKELDEHRKEYGIPSDPRKWDIDAEGVEEMFDVVHDYVHELHSRTGQHYTSLKSLLKHEFYKGDGKYGFIIEDHSVYDKQVSKIQSLISKHRKALNDFSDKAWLLGPLVPLWNYGARYGDGDEWMLHAIDDTVYGLFIDIEWKCRELNILSIICTDFLESIGYKDYKKVSI